MVVFFYVPLKNITQIYFFVIIMQDYLELYSQTDLAKKVSVDRHKIAKDTVKYIPIRIRTYQTRNNK